jgi:arylsulfatase A-like enzyme
MRERSTCGVLGTILVVSALLGCTDEPRRIGPPDIVFIVIDTLRADHLPSYGYAGDTAPFLTRFAESGALFERVIAPSSWTKTSMASIMTGLDPASHGVLRHRNVVPQRLATLAERLSAYGYETIGINTNPWLQAQFGFDAGYEVYETIRRDRKSVDADVVNRRALELLSARSDDRPLFLYLHYMDVHAPYRPFRAGSPGPGIELPGRGAIDDATLEFEYRKEGLAGAGVEERVIELYDEGIRQFDAALESVLSEIGASIPAEELLIVITSDHGEGFREHGTTEHGHNLYPEVVDVPLMFRWPGVVPAGVRIDAQVRSIDIAPTILALAGVNVPEAFEGEALLPMQPGEIADRTARSEVYFRQPLSPFHFTAVVSPDHFYVREEMQDTVEFYDLRADPGARNDLGGSHPLVATYRALERSAAAEKPAERELDDETRGELEALGYLK